MCMEGIKLTVFLYAGQGSQFAKMGQDFYEAYPAFKEVIDSASLDFDLKSIMFEGTEEEINDTRYTQPCMAAFAAGVTEILKENGITADAAAGLSLGEYGALYAAGVFDKNTYLDVVNFRGKAMKAAAMGTNVAMSAIVGTSPEAVEEGVRTFEDKGFVTIANYNCPGQYVICGEETAVAAVEAYMKENYKARAMRLKTSGPFHTKLLKQAGDDLAGLFENMTFNKPAIKVAMNLTGRLLDETDDIKKLLELQVQSSVRFEDDLRSLVALGADRFIEIGPGNVLTGLLKKTLRTIDGVKMPEMFVISKASDLEKLINQ